MEKISYPEHIHIKGKKTIVSREIGHGNVFEELGDDNKVRVKKKIDY